MYRYKANATFRINGHYKRHRQNNGKFINNKLGLANKTLVNMIFLAFFFSFVIDERA